MGRAEFSEADVTAWPAVSRQRAGVEFRHRKVGSYAVPQVPEAQKSMETLSVADLCAQRGVSIRQLAERSGLDERRVEAIVSGRWTPSPSERDRIAAAFGLSRDQIAWGHKNPVSHVYGHGPQFGRSP
jgi:ribosome-binding protein aMBF1 (putative translation factor)